MQTPWPRHKTSCRLSRRAHQGTCLTRCCSLETQSIRNLGSLQFTVGFLAPLLATVAQVYVQARRLMGSSKWCALGQTGRQDTLHML